LLAKIKGGKNYQVADFVFAQCFFEFKKEFFLKQC
jgi:hypothetical protein